MYALALYVEKTYIMYVYYFTTCKSYYMCICFYIVCWKDMFPVDNSACLCRVSKAIGIRSHCIQARLVQQLQARSTEKLAGAPKRIRKPTLNAYTVHPSPATTRRLSCAQCCLLFQYTGIYTSIYVRIHDTLIVVLVSRLSIDVSWRIICCCILYVCLYCNIH